MSILAERSEATRALAYIEERDNFIATAKKWVRSGQYKLIDPASFNETSEVSRRTLKVGVLINSQITINSRDLYLIYNVIAYNTINSFRGKIKCDNVEDLSVTYSNLKSKELTSAFTVYHVHLLPNVRFLNPPNSFDEGYSIKKEDSKGRDSTKKTVLIASDRLEKNQQNQRKLRHAIFELRRQK